MSTEFKVGDRVICCGKYHGKVVNVNLYREPSLRYAVDVDRYKDDVVFYAEDELEFERKKEANNGQNNIHM